MQCCGTHGTSSRNKFWTNNMTHTHTHTHTLHPPGGREPSAEWKVHCSRTATQKRDSMREKNVCVWPSVWVHFCINASISVFWRRRYLQNLLVQLQALALDEIASSGGHLICQVPQSTQGKLQSGVHHSHHGFLLHNNQQLLWDRENKWRKCETEGNDGEGYSTVGHNDTY